MELLHQIKEVLWHNHHHILETFTAWILFFFSHVIGSVYSSELVVAVVPYMQMITMVMACGASGFTMFKIYHELKKKRK